MSSPTADGRTPPAPTRADRGSAAAAVGWSPLRPRDVPGVAWTAACDGVPPGVRGFPRAVLAAWCWPARVALLGPGWYHRDGRRTTVSLARTPVLAAGVVVVLALVLFLHVARRDLLPPGLVAAVMVANLGVWSYALSVAVLQWARNRAERTPEERRGLFRTPTPLHTTWWLGRIALRDPGADRRQALAAAAALVRAVTAPGETVGAAAKSDRQQRELEAEGFAEPRGHKGLVVYPPPAD